MLWWLKSGQASQHQELSHRLGRAPATIPRWLAAYRQGGLSQLLATKRAPGATPKIQGEALAKLQARLKSEEGFGSCGEIVQWLSQECQLEVKSNTVNRFVRDKLKAKVMMVFGLIPNGFYQLVQSVNHSTWYARSAEVISSPLNAVDGVATDSWRHYLYSGCVDANVLHWPISGGHFPPTNPTA